MKVLHSVCGSLGNNCYLIVDESTNKSALVDCPEFSERILNLIGETELEYILLTHGHFDHIAGVEQTRKRYGAKVVISSDDSKMLLSSKENLSAYTGESVYCTEADIFVKDGAEIMLGNIKINVIATPGHTLGGVCYIAEDCIFSGDTLFHNSCGRTDFPGGSYSQLIQSLRRLSELNGDYKVYPGHESLSTLEYERKHNQYMNK